MHIVVTDHGTDKSKAYDGEESSIVGALLIDHPWLRSEDPADHNLNDTLEYLDASGNYEVSSDDAPQVENPGHVKDEEPKDVTPTEIDRLLKHPDPTERRMALRLDSVEPRHLATAALDPHPGVHQAAIEHPHFTDAEGHGLMGATADHLGVHPLAQQLMYLPRANEGHIVHLLQTARNSNPAAMWMILDALVKHPKLNEALVRTIYRGDSASNHHRAVLMSHPAAPPDILEHAIQTGVLFPEENTLSVARAAAQSPNLPSETRGTMALQVSDTSPETVVDLVCRALAAGPVDPGIGQGLQQRRMLRPSSENAAKVLGAYLRGPSASDGDIDQAIIGGHPAIWEGAARSPALQPRHMDQLVQNAHATGNQSIMSALMDHPAFGNRHLSFLMVPQQPMVKSEVGTQQTVRDLTDHPLVHSMMGHDAALHSWLQAARFLAGGVEVQNQAVRDALYQEDGAPDRAALRVYGLEISDANLDALKSVRDLSTIQKAEDILPKAQEIAPGFPEGDDVAAAVRRAYENQFVFYVKLDGKHSNGSMLAHDKETDTTWLLKSGSGGAGAAAGAQQDPSNPNAREAAWYHIAKSFGVDEWYPRSELIYIDGHAYAAQKLLPWSYKSLKDQEEDEPNIGRRILAPYLASGDLHMWGAMDFIFGNGDDNGGNIMSECPVDDHERRHKTEESKEQRKEIEKVRLIDHGSAFSGPAFDPANDKNSFIPYFMRAWAPKVNFLTLSPTEKLHHMPRVDRATADRLNQWFRSLDLSVAAQICQRYGINEKPQLDRAQKVRTMLEGFPFDEAINRLWATT